MDYLQILNAQGSILANIQSMKVTLAEIRTKKPESNYVQGLEKHIFFHGISSLTITGWKLLMSRITGSKSRATIGAALFVRVHAIRSL